MLEMGLRVEIAGLKGILTIVSANWCENTHNNSSLGDGA